MELNERDIDWHQDAPTLAAMEKLIPFTVPANYFTELTENLKSRVVVESARFEHQDEFDLPAGYFEDLAARIENRIGVENLRTQVPAEGFSIPDTYFSTLSAKINARIEDPVKRKPQVRRIFNSWISYAAAACVTAMIAAGLYLNSDTYTLNKEFSRIPDEEIFNYLQAHSTAGDTPFIIDNLNPEVLEQVSPDVSTEDIEQYINTTTL